MAVAMSGMLDAALAYSERFSWSVFPADPPTKRPKTAHGFHDATRDPAQIREWWRRWPDALIAVPTGAATGVIALDIDVSETVNGWDSLEEMGIHFAPETPMAHTPRTGAHCLFLHPGHFVKTTAGKLGKALDVRADGGYLILPPGPGRYWDPHFNLDTVPLAPMPEWMAVPEPAQVSPQNARPVRRGHLTAYGEGALDAALRSILAAGAGMQRETVNREGYGIGQLVAGGEIPADLAIAELCWAADRVQSLDGHRPWRPGECKKIVRDAFLDGQAHPRCAA